jgi:hypothetical protein
MRLIFDQFALALVYIYTFANTADEYEKETGDEDRSEGEDTES